MLISASITKRFAEIQGAADLDRSRPKPYVPTVARGGSVKKRFCDRPIIEEFKRRIEQRFPGELLRLIVFGSHARGDATAESDIDVLVAIHSENWKLGDEIRGVGYELEIEHGVVLSIQVIGRRYYEGLKARGSSF
jgi:predicted nucleotidyltransferase